MNITGFLSASVEDRGIGALDDGVLSEQTFPLQDGAGLRYSTLISAESNRDGKTHRHTYAHTHTQYTVHIQDKNKALKMRIIGDL